MISFASSIMKNIAIFPARSRFPIKLICCIVFGSESRVSRLLKFIVINLEFYLKYGKSNKQPDFFDK